MVEQSFIVLHEVLEPSHFIKETRAWRCDPLRLHKSDVHSLMVDGVAASTDSWERVKGREEIKWRKDPVPENAVAVIHVPISSMQALEPNTSIWRKESIVIAIIGGLLSFAGTMVTTYPKVLDAQQKERDCTEKLKAKAEVVPAATPAPSSPDGGMTAPAGCGEKAYAVGLDFADPQSRRCRIYARTNGAVGLWTLSTPGKADTQCKCPE